MVDLVLIAAAVGLSNFAASIGIGLAGVDARLRWRVGIVFGIFEAAMPVVGLLLGHSLSSSLGSTTRYVGGGLLIATGLFTAWQGRRGGGGGRQVSVRLGPLIATGAALSVDNLVVGFALGTHKISLGVAALTIGAVSVALSLAGLELGARLGASLERWSGELGGGLLVLVGIATAAHWF